MFALLLLAMIAHAADSCSPAFQGDPLCKEQYNDRAKMEDAANKAVQELENNPKVGIEGCTPNASTISLSSDLVKNTLLALFIVAMAVALLYMAGNFFQSTNALALAKQELNELVVTAIIAVLFASIVAAPTYFGVDLNKEAMHYSYKMLYKVSSVSAVLISANIALNSIYTIYIPFGAIRKAITIQLGPALRPLIDAVSFSLQFLITTYGEWTAFVFIFCFIQKWFLPFFFPMGLFLRAFPQTKGGGNTLIGISIALSTIYPLMFYIDSRIFDAEFPAGQIPVVSYFHGAIQALFAQLSLGGVGSLFAVFAMVYVSPVMIAAILAAAYMIWDVSWEVLRLVVVFSMILPIMNIFVTLAFAREMSRMLGTEINISAFAKLI